MNASAVAGDTVAVTVETPPSSEIDDGVSTNVTLGVAPGASSSSAMVSVASAGASMPAGDTLPDTRTVLSAPSTSLSTAAIVTSPVLSVALAAKLRVAPDSVKSASVAGASAVAATVTVNASADATVAVAVTVAVPPSSPIESGVNTSVTRGAASLSVMVRACCSPNAAPSAWPEISSVSSPSKTRSSSPVTVAVTLASPRGNVSSVALTV